MSEPNLRQLEHLDITDLLQELAKVSSRLTHALSEWAACTEERDAWKERALRAERTAREAELTVAQVRLWIEGERRVELLAQLVRRDLPK